MRTKIVYATLALSILFSAGCATTKNCPTCGTDQNGSVGIIDIIPVPEHNPTGEPGGPFNSFDTSWVDPVHHQFYVSDRIGLDVVVVDTLHDLAINAIGGANSIAESGNNASTCVSTIPPLITALGNMTRFGCRTQNFAIAGFGANGLFGGFPGAQCCASRSNGVNPLSGPDGETVTPDGNTLFSGNGSSSVVAFDLTTNPPTVIADIPTGQSPDYDGPVGIAPCIASASGRAFADPTCGDLRADEMGYDSKDQVLAIINGDPGLPFVTFIDVSGVVNRTSNCLPVNPNAPYGPTNFPSCIIGQIYYDGANDNPNVAVDTADAPCPDPSNFFDAASTQPVPSGVSGVGVGVGGRNVPCHHAPISPAGIGGPVWNPNTGHFLLPNANSSGDLTIGSIDDIDPRLGNPNGPVIINHFLLSNCMPTSIVQGPGNNFLVGCADHDGEAFPPNEYVIDGSTGNVLANIPYVGGVDEIWYNPGDNRYYVAARDMPNGPVLGVIDAGSNLWLMNSPTNTNSHSVSADPSNNHVFVPMQTGSSCTTQSANGCIAVYAAQ
jgi:hypothetical protein